MWRILFSLVVSCIMILSSCSVPPGGGAIPPEDLDPTTVLWYTHPADRWENALPVGNGRLGAMVFGRTDEEKIQFNEETFWSGGPYSQTAAGGYRALPEIQRLIFGGDYIKAHKRFGRHLLGYPIEQQKYQSFGDLLIRFHAGGEVTGYRHWLDLDRAVVTTRFKRGDIAFQREVFVSPVDQVIVVNITADRPSAVSFSASLRGYRNVAHSNYGTGYFHIQVSRLGNPNAMFPGNGSSHLDDLSEQVFHDRVDILLFFGNIFIEHNIHMEIAVTRVTEGRNGNSILFPQLIQEEDQFG